MNTKRNGLPLKGIFRFESGKLPAINKEGIAEYNSRTKRKKINIKIFCYICKKNH